MSGRAAVYETLCNSRGLNSLGITRYRIFPNYSKEERPIPTGPFLILRWGPTPDTRWQRVKEPALLTIWAHCPIEITDDFSSVERCLDACDNALRRMWDIPGDDGYTVSQVRVGGRSGDIRDTGFETITINANYQVLARIS